MANGIGGGGAGSGGINDLQALLQLLTRSGGQQGQQPPRSVQNIIGGGPGGGSPFPGGGGQGTQGFFSGGRRQDVFRGDPAQNVKGGFAPSGRVSFAGTSPLDPFGQELDAIMALIGNLERLVNAERQKGQGQGQQKQQGPSAEQLISGMRRRNPGTPAPGGQPTAEQIEALVNRGRR